jgi:UDP-glucose 4-epimerase
MRALVTGGAGFLGFHLARRLVEGGHRVDLVDNLARGVRDEELVALTGHPNAELFVADLCEPGCSASWPGGYDVIFHLAAIVGVARVESAPSEVLRQNSESLIRVLDYARTLPTPPRLVFASTSEVYAGHRALPIPTPEDVPLTLPDLSHPRTSYLLSKIYGEALLLHSGLPVTLVRPHNVYGPRMGLSHVIPELLQKVHAASPGAKLRVRAVNHSRAFCYVDDAVEMLLRVAEIPDCVGRVINLGTAAETRILELAETILRVVDKDLPIEPLEARTGDPERRCPQMALMERLTGFRAKIAIDEGLSRTYAWYRDRVFEGEGPSAR